MRNAGSGCFNVITSCVGLTALADAMLTRSEALLDVPFWKASRFSTAVLALNAVPSVNLTPVLSVRVRTVLLAL